MSTSRQAFALAIALSTVTTAAVAQEYCVVCTEPNALYRCILDDARPGVASSLQMVCISRIAKEGGHAQCAVRRGVTVFECDGVVKRISMTNDTPQPTQPAAPITAGSAGTGPVGAAPPAPPQAPAPAQLPAATSEPPKTVAEMAKRAKADSDKQMEKAGTFLKNSLGCIASLFTKCSSGKQ